MTVNSISATEVADYEDPQDWDVFGVGSNPTEDKTGMCITDEEVSTSFWIFDNSNSNGVTLHIYTLHQHTLTSGTGTRFNTASWGLSVRTKNVIIEGLSFIVSGSSSGVYTETNADNVTFRNILVHLTNTAGFGTCIYMYGMAASTTITMEGCGFVNDSASTVEFMFISGDAASTVNCYNCAWLQTQSGMGSNWTAIAYTAGTHAQGNLYNCKILGPSINGVGRKCVTSDYGGFGGDYNVTSDTTGPGANSSHNQAAADHFVDASVATFDLHINVSLDKASFIGTDYMATSGYSDVDGHAWNVGYCDIGPDSVSAAPASGNPTTGAERSPVSAKETLLEDLYEWTAHVDKDDPTAGQYGPLVLMFDDSAPTMHFVVRPLGEPVECDWSAIDMNPADGAERATSLASLKTMVDDVLS